eukprot:CFRG7624T1
MSGDLTPNADGSLNLADQQRLVHCGRCSSMFMVCECDTAGHGVDTFIKGAPEPAADSTPAQLLNRWASLMVLIPSLYPIDAASYVKEEGPTLCEAFTGSGHKLLEMVEAYMKVDDQMMDKIVELFKAYNIPQSKKGKEAVREEALAAAKAYIKGDFACITSIGRTLLNNAFQSSDPAVYKLDDPQLTVLFSGLNMLDAVIQAEFSPQCRFVSMEAYRSESTIAREFWDTHTSPN